MSHKTMMSIVSGIAVVALFIGVGVWLFSRERSVAEQPSEKTSILPPECPDILDDQKVVSVDVVKQASGTANEYEFAVFLQTSFPVNVAAIAFSYDPRAWKFVGTEADTSAFPIEAPGEEAPGFVKLSRGISGKGAGLNGLGEFARVVFQRVSADETVSDPTFVEAQSAVYLNNGCAAKGILRMTNGEIKSQNVQ